MNNGDHKYWIQLLEKLNGSTDMKDILQETLEELSSFFGFGVGFVYEADYKSDLFLTGCYGVYQGNTPMIIEASTFSSADLEEMKREKSIDFRGNSMDSALAHKLADIFSAKSMVFVPVFDKHGLLIACVGIADRRGEIRQTEQGRDFTEAVLTTLGAYIKMQMYQNSIETTLAALDSVLNHMGIDVYVNDYDTHEILYLNESMAAPYGKADDLIGKVCWQALYDDKEGECAFCPKHELISHDGNPTKAYSWDYKRPFDGSWFRVFSAAFPWVDGRLAQVISSVDITENKRNEELIRRMAEYDRLTGLPNRYRLANDCDSIIPSIGAMEEEGYIIFFDLDGFKQVNDELGHDVGDALLTEVGKYLMANPLTRERSYRYGGDEFVILCMPSTPAKLDEVIAYLREGFSTPWQLSDRQVGCGASFGISCFPIDSKLTSELMRMADQAMYQAKQQGAGQVYIYNQGEMKPWKRLDSGNLAKAENTIQQ